MVPCGSSPVARLYLGLRKTKRLRRRLGFSHVGRVREDFQMRHGKLGKQTSLEKPVSLV